MTTRARRLILLLRVTYITGASLFLLDVVISLASGYVGNLGTTEPTGNDTPFDIAMDWVAVIAFCFAALGALVTVFATSELVRIDPESLAEDAE